MKSYYRVMLGKKERSHLQECLDGSFIGAGYRVTEDLSHKLDEDQRTFVQTFAPVYLSKYGRGKGERTAMINCRLLWTVAKGICKGDIVLCPDRFGSYYVGEVTGNYAYEHGESLPHRRPVRWVGCTINRSDMSEHLQGSTAAPVTVVDISKHAAEIEKLMSGIAADAADGTSDATGQIQEHAAGTSTEDAVDDPAAFAMEKHLEDFLVQNWSQTELGKEYDIYEEDGRCVGQQYATDTGRIDILAVSKDRKCLLVIELKKGRASDVVVGQTLRYLGYVRNELAEEGQSVKGMIIALEDDQRIRRALMAVPNISFYRYHVGFKLTKA
jgi:restriction system protein